MHVDNSASTEPRPREKLQIKGAAALSDLELLTVLLGSGIRGRSASVLARELLPIIDRYAERLETSIVAQVPGVGVAKASLLAAALEFSRRRIRPGGVKIRSSADVLPLVRHLADRRQEHFIAISLNGAHEVIATRVVTIGLVNSTQVHAREVFSDPISDRACAVIVAHNHPSGCVEPSIEDAQVTKSLREAGRILGIKLLDHIVFGPNSHYSFAEHGGI
jgi:DNA repair protein RadC